LSDAKWFALALPTDSSKAIAGGVAAAYFAQFFKNARRASTSNTSDFFDPLAGIHSRSPN
jgi:hypothetical protein